MARKPSASLVRRALRIDQSADHPLYLFALTADELSSIADISRISRNRAGKLIGYQRPEVKRHINQIVDYLDSTDVVFPNAIILALSSKVRFRKSRGPNVSDGLASAGDLIIPIPSGSATKPGWIVDGQQRMAALSRAKDRSLAVPVAAFVSDTVDMQRDQFLRINNVHPLPRGLVTELLPEVATPLSPKLAARKIPSALCDLLNQEEDPPFHGLVKRSSSSPEERRRAVVTDTSLVKAIEESLNSPSGSLFAYRNLATGDTDMDGIWSVLLCYWHAVREAFPEAWGLSPSESRLMHGVGIRSMGRLMDRVMASVQPERADASKRVRMDLERIAPHCHWTAGNWEALGGMPWNELQNVPKHVRTLSNALIRLYLQTRQGTP